MLVPTPAVNSYEGNGFKCDVCNTTFLDGISLNCARCQFDVCMDCQADVRLPHLHRHKLQLVLDATQDECSGCHLHSRHKYRCGSGCNFYLCPLCAKGRDKCGAPPNVHIELVDEGDECSDEGDDDACLVCMDKKRCVVAVHGYL